MIISVDFDGTLSSYESDWQGADVVSDPPVDGAIHWLRDLIRDTRFEVHIFSSRSHQAGGAEAMQFWLYEYGLERDFIDQITFPFHKPPAFVTIDDRTLQFQGVFPDPDTLASFKAWWEK